MTYDEVNSKIDKCILPVREFYSLTETRVNTLRPGILEDIDKFTSEVECRISCQEIRLIDHISVITLSAQHHINRIYFHASPGLVAILLGIAKVVGVIITTIKLILSSNVARIIFNVHKILYALWPEYKTKVDKILTSISNVARQIGMGVDGIGHLLNACAGGASLISGLKKEDHNTMLSRIYGGYVKHTKSLSEELHFLENDPGKYIARLFTQEKNVEREEVFRWWDDVQQTFDDLATSSVKTLETISTVIDDFREFTFSMPQFVRDNIPSFIYEALYVTENFITTKILPAINDAQVKIDEIDAVLDSYRTKADELVNKMGRPGDILLGVDDLPEYMQNRQLFAIDDVTSRKFEADVENERLGMSGQINQLESLREALSVPTPSPKILDFETPEYQAISGIVTEPHETWFVGDY